MSERQQGKLVVISGPSGTGKSTVVARLLDACPLPLVLSISVTTRPPRAGEQDGVNYHFVSDEQFTRLRENDELLEYVEVFGKGHWYGTLRSEVAAGLREGQWVILEIDVEGAQRVMQQYGDAITIFIHSPDLDELERRLRNRKTEDETAIQRRLEVARRELALAGAYQHQVVNDSLDRAVQEVCDILTRSGG